jgi:O-methyltransferase
MRQSTRHRVARLLEPLMPLFNHLRWGGHNPIRPWRDEPEFVVLFREIQERTLVDESRCFTLFQLAGQARSLPGDVVEIGVYKGGTARLLARSFGPTDKTVHLFDTFSGLPDPDPARDYHQTGEFGDASLESVRRYLADCGNVMLYPGRFPETAGPVESGRFCLAHVDIDLYRSAVDCCEFLYPRLVPGGLMIFDDYGFRSCPGVKRAVDEFFEEKPETPVYLPTGQSLVIRL